MEFIYWYLLTFIRYTDIRYQEHFTTFNFNQKNIYGFNKIKSIDETILNLKTTECFITKNGYIECLFTRLLHSGFIDIRVFDSNLNKIKDAEYLAKVSEESFIKIFHIKNEIGGYVYFDSDTNQPQIQIKTLNLDSKPILINQFEFDYIILNGNFQYTLSNNLFLSDVTKINDQKFSVILTRNDLTNILICLFDIYNNDNSIKLRYFNLDLSKINIKLSVNIRAFTFKDYFGISFYNSNTNFPGYIIFSYPNITKINEIIFSSNKTEHTFPLKDNIEISNNIFGYEIIKIKINNFNDTNLSGISLFSSDTNSELSINQELDINDKIIFKKNIDEDNIGKYILELIPIIKVLDYEEYESLADQKYNFGEDQKNFYDNRNFNSRIINIYYIIENECDLAFHKLKTTSEKICYDVDFCYLQNYKYYLYDKKQCTNEKCPLNYYQHNFQCYEDNCPFETNLISSQSNICQSTNEYCIINEHYQTICKNTPFEGYIYKFDKTNQYLRSCNESLIYTINEVKTYLFNEVCYIECPENSKKNEEERVCECKYYYYIESNGNYICYSEKDKCGDKILIVDLKECEESIIECTNKGYKLFYDVCYKYECPENSKYDEKEQECKCLGFHYIDKKDNNIKCTSDYDYCPEGYPYELTSTLECLSNCPYEALLNESVKINNINNFLDNITDNVNNIIFDERYNNENIVIKGRNIAYEIFSSENNTYHEDISFINLEECAKLIKDNYNIEFFRLFKIDYRINGTDPTTVRYKIYDPENKTEINLSLCIKTEVTIELDSYFSPDIIDTFKKLMNLNYDLFNIKDSFYNDICTPFTTDDQTDMLLSDRRITFFKYFNICEYDCNYTSYDLDSKRIKCKCPIRQNSSDILNIIKFDPNNLKSFFSIKTYANFAVLKCYKLAFSKEGQFKNFGSYLLDFLTLSYIILIFIFYDKYNKKIKGILNFALGEKIKISPDLSKDIEQSINGSNNTAIKKNNSLEKSYKRELKNKIKDSNMKKNSDIKKSNENTLKIKNSKSPNSIDYTKDSKNSIIHMAVKEDEMMKNENKNESNKINKKID